MFAKCDELDKVSFFLHYLLRGNFPLFRFYVLAHAGFGHFPKTFS